MKGLAIIELSGGRNDGLRIAVPTGLPDFKVREAVLNHFADKNASIVAYEEVKTTTWTYEPTGIFTEDEEAKVYRLRRKA